MSDKVNIALVGLGFGAEFIPIYLKHPNGNVVAICQRNEASLNEIGDQFGIAKRYTSYDELLADPEIDAVHINTPIGSHAPHSIQALKAGKHVACTVPMATTVDECREICDLCKVTGLTYMMMETVVYSREFLFVKELFDNGELGSYPVFAVESPARYGWLAKLLGWFAANALRDPLRGACIRIAAQSSGDALLFWIGSYPGGNDRDSWIAFRDRVVPGDS